MKPGNMKFLGTGAGEGVPNPFCTCRICKNARKEKGKEIRMRSSFLLSDKILIDMGADFFAQSLIYDVDFSNLEHVLFTHMHDDHINYTAIWERFVRAQGREGKPLTMYFVGDAYKFMTDFYLVSPLTDGREAYLMPDNIVIKRLELNQEYKIGGFRVTPVKAAHSTSFEKNGCNFLIENEQGKLYYALDSGYFTEEAFDALVDARLNTLICECTFPTTEEIVDAGSGHMDIQMCIKNLDRLYAEGAITEETKVYLSHISPMGMTHQELSEYMGKLERRYKVRVAYDGLEVQTMKTKAVIFDKDGVLMDFQAFWIPAAKQAAEYVLEKTGGADKVLIGKMTDAIGINDGILGLLCYGTYGEIAEAFAEVLEEEGIKMDIRALTDITKRAFIYGAEYGKIVPACKDLPRVLEDLKKSGLILAVATTDGPEITERCLKALGICEYFDKIYTDDGVYTPKPNPHSISDFCANTGLRTDEVVVVGDSETDIEFAANGSVMCIGVATNAVDRAVLEKNAAFVINDISQLRDVLK